MLGSGKASKVESGMSGSWYWGDSGITAGFSYSGDKVRLTTSFARSGGASWLLYTGLSKDSPCLSRLSCKPLFLRDVSWGCWPGGE